MPALPRSRCFPGRNSPHGQACGTWRSCWPPRQAPSLAARVSVIEAAHRVQGVLDVVDEMTVAPTPESLRSDVDIARAVRDCLQWDAYLPDERISCTVSAGTVTLRGSVDTWAQRGDA